MIAKVTAAKARLYCTCPACGADIGSIDHIEVGKEAGPWYCEECGLGYWMRRINRFDIHMRPTGEQQYPYLALFAFGGNLNTVNDLFLVKQNTYITKAGMKLEDAIASGTAFLHRMYSDQCPVNFMMRDVDDIVIYQNDTDPHECFKLIKVIPRPTDYTQTQDDSLMTLEYVEKIFSMTLARSRSAPEPELASLPPGISAQNGKTYWGL